MPACDLVVIGCSWGGLHALRDLLYALPADFEVPLAVAMHRGRESRDDTLLYALGAHSSLPVCAVEDKDEITPGRVYVAPADYHLLVEPGRFALSVDDAVHYARPSIDVLFDSAADAYGDRLLGVILTGANADGAAGLRSVKRLGGKAMVQDPGTAERREMPDAALAAVEPDLIGAIDAIAAALTAHSAATSEAIS